MALSIWHKKIQNWLQENHFSSSQTPIKITQTNFVPVIHLDQAYRQYNIHKFPLSYLCLDECIYLSVGGDGEGQWELHGCRLRKRLVFDQSLLRSNNSVSCIVQLQTPLEEILCPENPEIYLWLILWNLGTSWWMQNLRSIMWLQENNLDIAIITCIKYYEIYGAWVSIELLFLDEIWSFCIFKQP